MLDLGLFLWKGVGELFELAGVSVVALALEVRDGAASVLEVGGLGGEVLFEGSDVLGVSLF